jgi:high-affinity Fe2+/Pb2+ permease
MLKHNYFFIICLLLLLLIFLQSVVGSVVLAQQQQQPSVVWDEASKSWVSQATTAPPPPAPTTQPQPQQQYNPPTTVFQQQPTTIPTTAVTTSNATVDLGTLATVITPIIAGIAGIFVKQKKDMEKKDEEVKQETIKAIEQAIIPKLKQIVPVAEQTAKQDVKINLLAEELYKIMAEKANDIHDKPEIQQQKLIEDVVRSKMIAEQTKETSSSSSSSSSSIQWDEKTKSWVSK